MKKAGQIRLHMAIILALILFVVAQPVEAKFLKTGEVYSSLDGKRAIEVISQKELEITKGGDILLAQYNFKGGKLRIVYTALGTTFVEYYELLSEGLKDKEGNILYSKKLYNFFDVFKAAAIERNVEMIRDLSHPLYLSCVNDKLYQNIVNLYFHVFNKNMEIKEVRVEDVSKETIIKEGLKMAVFPDKRIEVKFNDGGGLYILLSLHNGEWKWVSFCNSPPVNKQYLKKVANAKANSDIKNAFTASMAYHVDFPEATVDIKKLREYGLKESEGVVIRIIDGRANYLKIEALHSKGDKKYIIGSDGRITKKMIR